VDFVPRSAALFAGLPSGFTDTIKRYYTLYHTGISNNAGSCQELFCIFCSLFSFFGHTTPFTLKSGLICSVKSCFDDHGSFVIFRSVSVRPKHLFDPYFDHDY
jgi:hypothetical protein